MTENIFIQDNCTLRVFHIEILECVRADVTKKQGNERFLVAGTSFNRPQCFPPRIHQTTLREKKEKII